MDGGGRAAHRMTFEGNGHVRRHWVFNYQVERRPHHTVAGAAEATDPPTGDNSRSEKGERENFTRVPRGTEAWKAHERPERTGQKPGLRSASTQQRP